MDNIEKIITKKSHFYKKWLLRGIAETCYDAVRDKERQLTDREGAKMRRTTGLLSTQG